MTSPKFTPGIVRLRCERVLPRMKLIQPKAEHYIVAPDGPGNRVVAAVHHVDGVSAEDTARLFAAAPELYAALEACREILYKIAHTGRIEGRKELENYAQMGANAARAALGKAVPHG